MKKILRFGSRLLAGVLTATMCLGLFTGAAPAEDTAEQLILGEMIYLDSQNEGAKALIDNSGMSGIESSVHLCGIDSKDMYMFNGTETVVLYGPRAEALGQLYIWNYNDPNDLGSGIKEINIQYSVDGANWSTLGNYTLNQSSADENNTYGGTVACNLDTPIDFGGVPARFIALTPVSNYGGSGYGLSEVRVFRHKIRPDVGSMVTGEVINITVGNTPEAATNNQGMSDLKTATATHNNNPADMWLSTDELGNSYYPVNLDGTYPLSSITLWNYNDPSNLGAGIKEFEIYYTVGSPCGVKFEKQGDINVGETFDFSRGDWQKITIGGESVFTLPQGDGSDAMSASLTLTFDEVIEAQHFKLVPKSNYGGNGYGLSEMRFFAGKGWGVEPARKWTGLLSSSGTFEYQGHAYKGGRGWIYADGVYSYHMTGAQSQGSLTEDSVVFITFEDSAYGTMGNYKNWNSYSGYQSASHSGWVNMSYLVLKGNEPDVRNAQFILQGKDSDIHPLNNIMAKVYWTGDLTWIDDEEGGGLYVHAPDVSDQDSGVPVDMIKIYFNEDMTPNMDIVPKVLNNDAAGEFIPSWADGTVYENTVEAGAPNPDGYIYVYTKNKSGLYRVVRCLPSDYINFDKYQFWSGEERGWVNSEEEMTPGRKSAVSTYSPGAEAAIAYMADGYFGGQYVNVYTEGSIEGQMKMGVSTGLTDLFMGEIDRETGEQDLSSFSIYWAPEDYKYVLYRGYDAVQQWNYNSKSHPALSAEGELLISYHEGVQNGTKTTMAYEYTHPVFINLFSVGEFNYGGSGNFLTAGLFNIGSFEVTTWMAGVAGIVVVAAGVVIGVVCGKKGKAKKAKAAAPLTETEPVPVAESAPDAAEPKTEE